MLEFWIAEISPKCEIRIEEPWRFAAKTATQFTPWFLASLGSVTSVALFDGVQNTQVAPKFSILFFSKDTGFVMPLNNLCCTVNSMHFSAERGEIIPLCVSTRGSLLNHFFGSSSSPVAL